jgi:hypothetical protein
MLEIMSFSVFVALGRSGLVRHGWLEEKGCVLSVLLGSSQCREERVSVRQNE